MGSNSPLPDVVTGCTAWVCGDGKLKHRYGNIPQRRGAGRQSMERLGALAKNGCYCRLVRTRSQRRKRTHLKTALSSHQAASRHRVDRFSGLTIVGLLKGAVSSVVGPTVLWDRSSTSIGETKRAGGSDYTTQYHSIGLEPSYLSSASWKGSSSRNEAGTFHLCDREFR
jgi:hypothetical protein